MPTLEILDGHSKGQVFVVEGNEVLGRESDVDVQVFATGVSRKHAQVVRADPYYFLVDLRSSNGTWVNGVRVHKWLLVDGDVITLGGVRLQFRDERGVVRPPEAPPADPLDPFARPDAGAFGAAPEEEPPSSRAAKELWKQRQQAEKERARLEKQAQPPEPKPAEPREPKPAERGGGARGEGLLDRLGRDLTALARAGRLDPVIGRSAELRRLAQVLLQKRKPNAILVGDAGVGKTCIVEGLAQRIVSPECPRAFVGKRVVELSMASLLAGTKYRGELEERMDALLREAEADPDLILFLDEIHTAMGAGRSEGGALDVANQLKPVLARSTLRVIGATTTQEYDRHVARDAAFARRFEVVWVDEPNRAETLLILERLRESYAEHHHVEILPEALELAVDLSLRYLTERRLPDKALDLLDQACAHVALGTFRASDLRSGRLGSVDADAVAAVVAERCRVPKASLLVREEQRLEDIERALAARVVGQAAAVRQVADALRTARAGLKDPRRPVASFLLVGPSGVGKTELAKALAAALFRGEERLIHLDMSEYMERHSVSRLYGAPPGYVGYGEEGQLTGPIRKDPCAVVLLDEIEKAHPEVLDVLLQLLDEGRVTDGHGRRADFREAVILLTSNLGADARPRGALGFGASGDPEVRDPERDAARRRIAEAVEGHLRPELINRLTATIVFDPLTVDDLERIVEKAVDAVRGRLAQKAVSLDLDADARRDLAERAHDPRYGARPVARLVEREVSQPLAQALVDGRLPAGARARVVLRDGAVALDLETA